MPNNSTLSPQHSTLAGRLLLYITVLACSVSTALAWSLPSTSQQVIVGIADNWNSSYVTVTLFEKKGTSWKATTQPVRGRLGKNGLAWGLGIHPFANKPYFKQEGDRRAPAGVYTLGDAFGYHKSIKKHRALRYTQVTTRDLWVEDSTSRYYNQHIRLDHEPASSWEKKAQMRQNDYPHSLKLFVHHNAVTKWKKATPNAGSAIFFHIWRNGGKSATFGCTTLPEPALRKLISKLNPKKKPLYVLLPKAEYQRLRAEWQLP